MQVVKLVKPEDEETIYMELGDTEPFYTVQ